MLIPPDIAHWMAADERVDKSFASVDEAIATRIGSGGLLHTPREYLEEEMQEHLERSSDGRYRYRYSQEAVVAVYEEMTSPPPPFERLAVPTLLVVAAASKLVSAGELELYRQALGDLLEVVVVPGGHLLLWDAYEETAAAVSGFLD
jgi:pimeloyl-ACP methyl ester carboxylesterase